MGDYGARLRIDLEHRLAARALDFKHSFGHSSIVNDSHRSAPAYSRGRDDLAVKAVCPQLLSIPVEGIDKTGARAKKHDTALQDERG